MPLPAILLAIARAGGAAMRFGITAARVASRVAAQAAPRAAQAAARLAANGGRAASRASRRVGSRLRRPTRGVRPYNSRVSQHRPLRGRSPVRVTQQGVTYGQARSYEPPLPPPRSPRGTSFSGGGGGSFGGGGGRGGGGSGGGGLGGFPLTYDISNLVTQAGNAAAALATFPAQVRNIGASIIEAKRQFAALNGTIAVSLSRLDAQRFGRSVRLAAATAGTTGTLTQAQNRLEEKLLPYQVASENALNRILAIVENMSTAMVTGAEKVYSVWADNTVYGQAAKGILSWLTKATPINTPQPMKQLAQEIADGKFSGRNNPPGA